MKKYKIRISYSEAVDEFETELPLIPSRGDTISFWYNSEWTEGIVESMIHELNKDNSYSITELYIVPFDCYRK